MREDGGGDAPAEDVALSVDVQAQTSPHPQKLEVQDLVDGDIQLCGVPQDLVHAELGNKPEALRGEGQLAADGHQRVHEERGPALDQDDLAGAET